MYRPAQHVEEPCLLPSLPTPSVGHLQLQGKGKAPAPEKYLAHGSGGRGWCGPLGPLHRTVGTGADGWASEIVRPAGNRHVSRCRVVECDTLDVAHTIGWFD